MTNGADSQAVEVEMVPVNAKALHQLLQALIGPGHFIRELQATRNLDNLSIGDDGYKNPINVIIDDYNKYVNDKKTQAAQTGG